MRLKSRLLTLVLPAYLAACGGASAVPTPITTTVATVTPVPIVPTIVPTGAATSGLPTAIVTPRAVPTAAATPTRSTSAAPPTSAATATVRAATPVSALYVADFATWFIGEEPAPVPFRTTFNPASAEYHLAITSARQYFSYYRYAPEGRGFADFQLDVDVRWVTGPDTGGSYGVVFRAQRQAPSDQTSARYALFINADRTFSITLVNADGTSVAIAPKTASAAIGENGKPQHLTVICKGTTLSLAINGQAVGTYPALLTTEGAIGVIVANPRDPSGPTGIEVAFGNLRLTAAP